MQNLTDFLQETTSNNGGFQDVNIEWLKFNKNETKELIILSRVNTHIDDEPVDNFNPDRDLYFYWNITPQFGKTFNDASGNKWYMNLPVLSEELHNNDNSNNPFFDIRDVLGIKKEFVKPKFLMWVMDANAPAKRTETRTDENGNEYSVEVDNVFLWSPAKSIVMDLAELELMNMNKGVIGKDMGLLGRVVSVKRTDPKGNKGAVQYSVQPDFTSFTNNPIDVDAIELPNAIGDNVSWASVDQQVNWCNRVRDDLMSWLQENGSHLKEYPFTIDDENFNGTIKPEFLSNGKAPAGFEV